MYKIKINTNDGKIVNSSLTQEELVKNLKLKLHHDLFLATETKLRKSNMTIITFTEKDEQGKTSVLEIRIDEKVCHTNPNVQELKKIAKACKNHVTYINKDLLIKKAIKIVVGVTATATIIAMTPAALNKISEEISKKDNERFETEQEHISSLYKDNHGFDVRNYPTFGDKGYWLDEHHYIDENNIKWHHSSNGEWTEMGEVVKDNKIAEEMEYEIEGHHKGL